MRIGFSFSPGGLLLPYHVGVMGALEYHQMLTPETPIAGSSAGAIACASHASRVPSTQVLEATIDISDRCEQMGGARGRLLPLLKEKLDELLTEDRFDDAQSRPGVTGIAYREVFPRARNILQTQFGSRSELVRSVCHSSMFPFFTTNLPFLLDTTHGFPRLLVDGYFTVPRERFGCPDFSVANIDVDRTVTVTCFPKDKIGLDDSLLEDCISPRAEGDGQIERLFRIATQATSRKELTSVYEEGWQDAEQWVAEEKKRLSQKNAVSLQ